jgi:hypothetical protein
MANATKLDELREKATKGIVFSGPLVRMIEGYYGKDALKTQTRRVATSGKPSYAVGDILYIKETWQAYAKSSGVAYRDFTKEARELAGLAYWNVHYRALLLDEGTGIKWNSSRFMPRIFARLFIEVLDVEHQRIWEITDQDARAEGIQAPGNLSAWELARYDYRDAFRLLWDQINPESPFEDSPIVWRYKFKLLEPAR